MSSGKREESLSENEDVMIESQPQTPTSPAESHHSFPAVCGTDTSFIKERSASSSSTTSTQHRSSREDQPRAKEPLKPSSSLPDVIQGFSR